MSRSYYDFENGPVGGPFKKYRCYKAKQCRHADRFLGTGRCQGLLGHEGFHWYYREDGYLIEWPSKKDKEQIAYKETPPGAKSYPDPAKKFEEVYYNFNNVVELPSATPDPVAKS